LDKIKEEELRIEANKKYKYRGEFLSEEEILDEFEEYDDDMMDDNMVSYLDKLKRDKEKR